MAEKKIAQYKKSLEAARTRLLREIQEGKKPTDFGDDVEDSSEEADEAEEFSNRLAVVRAKKEELEEVEGALRKIAEKTYGKCDACGGLISEKVLQAAPESILCEKCKRTR